MSRSIVNWPDIRQRMRSKGITQTQIAEALGIPQSAVSNLLTGARSLKFDEALALERLIGGIFGLPVAIAPLISLWRAAHWHDVISLPDGWVPMPPTVAGPKSFAVGFDATPNTPARMEDGYWASIPTKRRCSTGTHT